MWLCNPYCYLCSMDTMFFPHVPFLLWLIKKRRGASSTSETPQDVMDLPSLLALSPAPIANQNNGQDNTNPLMTPNSVGTFTCMSHPAIFNPANAVHGILSKNLNMASFFTLCCCYLGGAVAGIVEEAVMAHLQAMTTNAHIISMDITYCTPATGRLSAVVRRHQTGTGENNSVSEPQGDGATSYYVTISSTPKDDKCRGNKGSKVYCDGVVLVRSAT